MVLEESTGWMQLQLDSHIKSMPKMNPEKLPLTPHQKRQKPHGTELTNNFRDEIF
jgi:hypothetical protein